MIKQRTMGRTGLKLSELSLGTLNFGWKTDEISAYAILDAYYGAGGKISFKRPVAHPSTCYLLLPPAGLRKW